MNLQTHLSNAKRRLSVIHNRDKLVKAPHYYVTKCLEQWVLKIVFLRVPLARHEAARLEKTDKAFCHLIVLGGI